MRKSLLFFVFVIASMGFTSALAQSGRPGPPGVALIIREDIKPGMMAPHSKQSAKYARLFSKLETPNRRIALVPVAGSQNEVIYIIGAENFGQIESMQQETDKKLSSLSGSMAAELDRMDKDEPLLHAGMRDMLAVLRPDLSYNPGVSLPTMRYMAVTTVRLKPGQEDQYAEYVNSVVKTARDKVKAELHVAAFQIIAGLPSTTYLFFRPMRTLGEYDLRIGPRVRDAMSDDQKKKADKLVADSVMFSETSVYALNPQMSYVSKEFAAADPTFWTHKPEMAAKPKPKRRAPKPPPPPPAN